MYGMKCLFVGVAIILVGNVVLSARAQAPAAIASPKHASSPTERVGAERSVLAESSKQAAKSEAAAAEFCQCIGQGDNSATKRIEQALSAPLHRTGLDYAEQPLSDVVTQLSDEYGIPILLNKVALEEAGIGTDKPVTVTVHNLSLRSALRLMLKSLQLAYVIEDEVLFITTAEDAEKNLKVCVYDIRKIAGDKADLTALMDTISSCVARETWAKNGKGSAEIRSPKAGFLVITQTQAVHNDIRNLLTTMDEMRRDQAGVSGAPTRTTTGASSERRTPASPVGIGAPRKDSAPRQPAQNASDVNNPFSG
jgi:type II secretory pathway component GspD/PulD (secretin)